MPERTTETARDPWRVGQRAEEQVDRRSPVGRLQHLRRGDVAIGDRQALVRRNDVDVVGLDLTLPRTCVTGTSVVA